MTNAEKVLEAVRTQIGENYYSMNYSSDIGFAGNIGTHYIGEGWGCAKVVAFGFNSVLGTRYEGSVWNFVGDAFGDYGYNQGQGQFIVVNEPEIGDVIAYQSNGTTGSDCTDYGHVAMYSGNGNVIGAMGIGKPSDGSAYLNIGVTETTINKQSLGNGYIILRCTKLDSETPFDLEDDEMMCLIQPNEESILWYFDGTTIHPLGHPDEAEAIRMIYRNTHDGREIPEFSFGTKNAPWATRLLDAIRRKL